eukprot:5395913-Prymnesium_polylepis.1
MIASRLRLTSLRSLSAAESDMLFVRSSREPGASRPPGDVSHRSFRRGIFAAAVLCIYRIVRTQQNVGATART